MKVTGLRVFCCLVLCAGLARSATAQEFGEFCPTPSHAYDEVGRVTVQNHLGYVPLENPPFDYRFLVDNRAGSLYGYENGYTNVGAVLFKHLEPNRQVLFVDGRAMITHEGQGGMNFGVGIRRYLEEYDRLFGLAFWWDYDDGHRAGDYSQFGVSFESLGRYFDYRVNGYLPTDKGDNQVGEFIDPECIFIGNRITQNRFTSLESAYGGFDLEVGGVLPLIGRYGFYGYTGGYFFFNDNDEDIQGVSGRLHAQVTEDVSIGVEVTNDNVFDTNAQLSVTLVIPDGKPSRWFRPMPVAQRLYWPMERNYRVTTHTRVEVTNEELFDPVDLLPLNVVFVDPNAVDSANVGTFEDPYLTLRAFAGQDAPERADADIILVAPGPREALNGGIGLLDNQRLWSTTVPHRLDFVDVRGLAGTCPLFENGLVDCPPAVDAPYPVLTNTRVENIEGTNFTVNAGPIVTLLGNNTEVSGFVLEGADVLARGEDGRFLIPDEECRVQFAGITNRVQQADGTFVYTPITNFNINNNVFRRLEYGVDLRNIVDDADGVTQGILDCNTFTNITRDAARIEFAGTETFNLRVQQNQFGDPTDPAAEIGGVGLRFRADSGDINLLIGSAEEGEEELGNLFANTIEGGVNIDLRGDAEATIEAGHNIMNFAFGGGNIFLTGHDVLLHGGQEGLDDVILDFIRGGILASDYSLAVLGSDVGFWNFTGGAQIKPGYESTTFYNVNTATAADWDEILSHDAIIILSHESCGGCDLDDAGSAAINAMSGAIAAAVNRGMDIWANSGADLTTYYNFLPPNVLASGVGIGQVAFGFNPTPAGSAIGITPNMINGYPTHSRFQNLDPAFTIFETHETGAIISIGVQNANIGASGFGRSGGDGFVVSLRDDAVLREGTVFRFNDIRGFGNDGLRIEARNRGLVEDLLVDQNVFAGNGRDGLSLQAIGPNTRIFATVTENVLSNNGRNGMYVLADGGRVILERVVDNEFSSNGANGIHLETRNGGFIQIFQPGGDVKRTFDNVFFGNANAGILVSGVTGTVDLGLIEGQTFDRRSAGGAGILFDTCGVAISAVIRDSQFLGSGANANASFGIGGRVLGGSLAMTVEDSLFQGNGDAGIGIIFGNWQSSPAPGGPVTDEPAIASLTIVDNVIEGTAVGPRPTFDGEGIHLRLQGDALLIGTRIDGNDISGNASDGITIFARDNSRIQDLTIGNTDFFGEGTGNSITGNGGDGINFFTRDQVQVENVVVGNNIIDGNADDGIQISAINQGDNVLNYLIQGNEITTNVDNGIHLHVEADAPLEVDINDNLIDGNGGSGILLTEAVNSPSDEREISGTWTKNEITNNGEHGIQVNAAHDLVIGQNGVDPIDGESLGNLIADNALDGIEINSPGFVEIVNNDILRNGTGGIDINSILQFGNVAVINNNVISENEGDGVEILASSTFVNVTMLGNEITRNTGRGIDVLNRGFTPFMILNIGDGTGAGSNLIASNFLEGVYIVNTASATQSQDVPATDAMDANGSVFARPVLQLGFEGNVVESNGNPGLTVPQANDWEYEGTASGLVIRVGTSDGGYSYTFNGGFASDGFGGVVADVTDNIFRGNFGDDVYAQSFVSTVDPITTTGTWSETEFTVTNYQSDPLARLDMVFRNNIFDSIDMNNPGAFYDNAEGTFKSRLNSATPGGPFNSATRRRNAQRLAYRDALPPFTGPNTPGSPNEFEYPGMGPSTFRIDTDEPMVSGTAVGEPGSIFLVDDVPYIFPFGDSSGVFIVPIQPQDMPYGWYPMIPFFDFP